MTVQGQGFGTQRKQELFYHALVLGMRVVTAKATLRRFPFWLFDGNCGSGWNDEMAVMGSPLAAHFAADNAGLDIARRRFVFCDKDRLRLSALQHRLGSSPGWAGCSRLRCGDNEAELGEFARFVAAHDRPPHALGAVIIDPNGYFYRNKNGDGPPIGRLAEFARQFPKIDLILNLNMRAFRLQRSQGHCVLPPEEVLQSLNRQHWLVGRINFGNGRFLVAVGRNFSTDQHARMGLFHLDGENGRDIILWAKGRRQPDLFKQPGIPMKVNVVRVSDGRTIEHGIEFREFIARASSGAAENDQMLFLEEQLQTRGAINIDWPLHPTGGYDIFADGYHCIDCGRPRP